MSRGVIALCTAALLCTVLTTTASAHEDPPYKYWPEETKEWTDLTNHIWSCYTGIVVRCKIVGLSIDDFEEPSYIWPMADYVAMADKLDSLIPRYVCQTNATPDGSFNTYFDNPTNQSFPFWSTNTLWEHLDITNGITTGGKDEYGWYTNFVLTSWQLASHLIQTQVMCCVTSLVWTEKEAYWTNELSYIGAGAGDNDSEAIADALGSVDDSEDEPDVRTSIWRGEDTHAGVEYGTARLRVDPLTNIFYEVDYYVYAQPSGSTWDHYGLDQLEGRPDRFSLLLQTARSDSISAVSDSSFGRGAPSEDEWASSGTRGFNLDSYGFAIIKWDFDEIELEDHVNKMADTDIDYIIDIDADVESFGPDSGVSVFRAKDDKPYTIVSLSRPPLWYGGLPAHAYISQGGHTNLPFHYLVPDLYDEDGYLTAYSLYTKVIESDAIEVERPKKMKQASILRPRGNLVGFDFPVEGEGFSAKGYPIQINSNRTYVLWDRTPGDHKDFEYDLYFESGVIHQYDSDGAIFNVKHMDGREAEVTPVSLPGGSVNGFPTEPSTASDDRYSVAITWLEEELDSVAYSGYGESAITTDFTPGQEGWIKSFTKTGEDQINDTGVKNISADGQTIEYEWGEITRVQTEPAGNVRTVTITTKVDDSGGPQSTVTGVTKYNDGDLPTEYTLSIDTHQESATTEYEYPTDVGMERYGANGFLKKAKLKSVTYPDGSSASYTYTSSPDPDTGWIDTSTRPVGNGHDRVTKYSYDVVIGGDEAIEINLVERPRKVEEKWDSTVIGETHYAYTDMSETEIKRLGDSQPNSTAYNLWTIDSYSFAADLTYGLLETSEYPAGNSDYTPLSVSGGKLTSVADHSSGETVTAIVNAFGHTESTTVVESNQTTYSAVSTIEGFGRPTQTTYHDGNIEQFSSYTVHGAKTVTERDGSVTTLTYYKTGWTKSVGRAAFGRSVAYEYDGLGNMSLMNEAGAAITNSNAYTYDAQSRLREGTDNLGQTTTSGYSKQGYGIERTTGSSQDTGVVEEYYKDGSLKAVGGGASSRALECDYAVDGGMFRKKESRTQAGGSNNWTKTFYGKLGLPEEIEHSGVDGIADLVYDSAGRLVERKPVTGPSHLREHNAQNRLVRSGLDVNDNGILDPATADIVETYVRSISSIKHETFVYEEPGSSNATLLSMTKTSLDGRQTTSEYAGETNIATRTRYLGAGKYNVTNEFHDGTKAIRKYDKWNLATVEDYDRNGVLTRTQDYYYDGLGALTTAVDSVSGITVIHLDPQRRVCRIVPSDPNAPVLQKTYYPGTTRVARETRPSGAMVRCDYYDTGLLKRKYDGDAYDISYFYDDQGRKTNMVTFRNGSSVFTGWEYHPATGRLQRKTIGGTTVESYGYRADGLVTAVTNADGVAKTLSYDAANYLVGITWSDDTSDTTYTNIDRLGRARTKICGELTNKYTYALDGKTLSVTNTGDMISESSITYEHHQEHDKVENITVKIDGENDIREIAYDDLLRTGAITNGLLSAAYSYDPVSRELDELSIRNDGTDVLDCSFGWNLKSGRVTNIIWQVDGSNVASYLYKYKDNSDRIETLTLENGDYWEYIYDSRSQLTSSKQYFADGTEHPAMQFAYDYDTIGNTINAGFILADGTTAHHMAANDLNLHVSRVWSNKVQLLGTASQGAGVVVTVNGQLCDRVDEWFTTILPIDNTVDSVNTNISVFVISNGVYTSVSGALYVAKASESVTHAATGAITDESRYEYEFDGYWRLTNAISLNASPNVNIRYSYYADGKRATKDVSEGSPGNWTNTIFHVYTYDGWNLVHESISNVLTTAVTEKYYLWGLDLAGRKSGKYGQLAGGIGGLLAITVDDGATTRTYLPISDHNGNILHLMDTDTKTIVANYIYSPFGVVVGEWYSSPLVRHSFSGGGFRFQSKYYDAETELYYYGYRYYDPASTKWLSRDPKGESGGINLTAFCSNDPVNHWDYLGLTDAMISIGLSLGWKSDDGAWGITGLQIVGSVRENLSDDAFMTGDIGYRRYFDGLGSSTDNNGPYSDLWVSLSGTYGDGDGEDTQMLTASPLHQSALDDPTEDSITWGQTLNWHSHMGRTRIGHLTLKNKNVFVHYANDTLMFPSFGGKTDYSWTASINVGGTREDGVRFGVGWADFTGQPQYGAHGKFMTVLHDGRSRQNGYHDQLDFERKFNRAVWYASIGDNNVNITYSEAVELHNTWLNLQNYVHDTSWLASETPRFIYRDNDYNKVIVSGSISSE